MMHKIVKDIVVDVSIEEVYRLWTTQDGLNKFFGEDSKIELVIDGPFEIYFSMNFEEGKRGSEGCKIIDFKDYQYLIFTWNVPPIFTDERVNNYRSQVNIKFEKISDAQTKLKLINEYHYNIDKLEDIINYFDKAWDYVLNNLIKVTLSKSL